MSEPRLFLDEDVRVLLAHVLRERRYDAVHVEDVARRGMTDDSQLAFATSQKRVLLTHNIRDFINLDNVCRHQGRKHAGILLSDQVPFRELLRRTLRFLDQVSAAEMQSQVRWLNDFRG